ncbi:MAG: amidohydrolase family protein [Vicinamibacterales bacterium]
MIVEGDKIKAVGTVDSLKPPVGAKIIDGRGKTVMPGLIDMHCHVDIVGHGNYDAWHPIVKARYKEVLPAASRDLLMAGVTTGREPGGFLETDLWVRDAVNRGEFPGPRRLVSGPYISFGDPAKGDSGPHGDPQSSNAHYLMVNTPETAREAAIYLLDKGVDLLKAYNNLTEPMVRAITEEAHKRGKHVASHVSGAADLQMRLRAGIDSVEHLGNGRSGADGNTYRPETLRMLAQSGVPVVPTLSVGLVYEETEKFPERIEDLRAFPFFPSDLQELIRDSVRNFSHLRYFDSKRAANDDVARLFRQLLDARVNVLFGSESGTPLNFHSSAAAREMVWMDRLGMDPMSVIVAATRGPARFLRLDDKYGSIETGKVADIILVDGNPLMSMATMHQVSFVMKDGVIYKGGDGASPGGRK